MLALFIDFLNMPLIGFLAFLGGILLLLLLALRAPFAGLKQVASGLLVSYVSIVLALLLGEAYFRFAYADSGWGFTLAHENWQTRYWQVNSRGFRDREWSETDLEGKEVIAVLGDSFASGWGVNNPADRFPDVLASHLGADYALVNLAIPGTSTPQQLDLLKEHLPTQADTIILQYFLNDIELASASVSRLWVADFVTSPNEASIAAETHLGNFIYWALYPLTKTVNATFEGSYWQWQYETYDNNVIWAIHEQQLNEFIDYVESIDAELYVVIFPNMEDPVGSVPYVDRVKFVFEERAYDDHVLTLYDEVAAWENPQTLVASPRDAHPSADFHRFVGDLLYERFFSE